MGRVPGDAAGAARPPDERPTIPSRVLGVILRPRATLAAAAADAHWTGILALSTILAATASVLFYATEVGRLALVDRLERTAAAFGREVDDASYATLQAFGAYSEIYGLGSAVAGVALLTMAVAILAFVVLPRRDGKPTFHQVMAVAAHASVILALRFVLAAPVGYVRETAAGATSVGVWMPLFGATSIASRFFGMLDLAILWWAVVVALGLAVLYDRPARRLALAFVSVYVAVALAAGTIVAVMAPA